MQAQGVFYKLFWFLIAFSLIVSCAFYAFPSRFEKGREKEPTGAIRLWHIDSFEGGKGSRASFLKSVANEYHAQNPNAFVLVSSYTVEGALVAFSQGEMPDLLSYSVGISPPIERCKPLSLFSFFAGALGKAQLALPWCKGGYALYALSETAKSPTPYNTVLSIGGKNLSLVTACLEGLAGAKQADSVTAYVDFLSGKYEWLLGTQRDLARFSSRGVSVKSVPLTQYCDLYQYVSILTEENAELCEGFLRLLFLEKTQKRLSSIGLMSAFYSVYDTGALAELEKITPNYYLGAFSSAEENAPLTQLALGGDKELLKKFLKGG